jgi:hypothetical protein
MLAAGETDQLQRIRPVDDILRSAAAVDRETAALRQDAWRTEGRHVGGPGRAGCVNPHPSGGAHTHARRGRVVEALT